MPFNYDMSQLLSFTYIYIYIKYKLPSDIIYATAFLIYVSGYFIINIKSNISKVLDTGTYLTPKTIARFSNINILSTDIGI